jgi:hypothetical protein
MPKKSVQIQDTITISAHQRKTVHNIFSTTVEFLEKYIEIAGYYDDWEQRKQIHNNEVVRKDIIGDPEKAEKSFSVTLFGFRQALENKPEFFRDELKEEFYRWISATGIDAKNAHPRLKNNLFGFHEILEGRGEKIMEDVLNRKDRLDVNSPDYAEKLNSFYAALQVPLEKGREQEKLLKDKTYRDMEIEKKFGVGDDEEGKYAFNQISESIEDYQNFHHFKQQGQQQSASSGGVLPGNPLSLTNPEIILNVKSYPQNWRIDEVITGYDNYGRATKKELALFHNSAEVGYDGAVSNLQSQPIYPVSRFNQDERTNIERALGISQTPINQPIRQELVNDILQNIDRWRIENKVVSHTCHAGKWYKGQPEPVLIRQDAEEVRYNQSTGELIRQPGKVYVVKEDLTEAERKAIGYKSETGLQTSSSSITPKNDDKGIGKVGIIAIVGVVSAFAIAGIVLVKKSLKKKVKK